MSSTAAPGEEPRSQAPTPTPLPQTPPLPPMPLLPPASQPSGYAGPPRTVRPPHGWQTPVVVRPASPRALPHQDQARIDAEEQSAKTITYGVAMVAGAVMFLLVLVLCGRALF